MRERWRRIVDRVLSIGAYPGETEAQRGRRRIVVVAFLLASMLSIPTALQYLATGYLWVGVANGVVDIAGWLALLVIALRPRWFAWAVNGMFVMVAALVLAETALLGGLYPSSLAVVFGLIVTLAVLVVSGLRAALAWFVVFVASVVYALVIPSPITPLHTVPDPTPQAAFSLVALGVAVLAVMAYFDMWGDTVDIASRMGSEGVPGQIQVSSATRDALAGDGSTFDLRGVIPVKGRGEMETYLPRGRTSTSMGASAEDL
jgi:MFS family permease